MSAPRCVVVVCSDDGGMQAWGPFSPRSADAAADALTEAGADVATPLVLLSARSLTIELPDWKRGRS